MTARKPLAVGDRVRVDIGTERYDGTVFEVLSSNPGSNPIVLVKFGGSHPDYRAWSSQCRRLRAKNKEPERVERWMAFDSKSFGGVGSEYLFKHESEASAYATSRYPACIPVTRLVELKKCEAIVSREKLAEASAWCDKRKNQIGNKNSWFENLCEFLSLPSAPAKEGKG